MGQWFVASVSYSAVGCKIGRSRFSCIVRSAGRSDSPRVVRLVDRSMCLVVRLSLEHDQSVCHLGSGLIGWMVDGFVGV